MQGSNRAKLSDYKIDTLKPPTAPGRYEVWDTLQQGLKIRVSHSGKKVWYLWGRADGKAFQKKLGPYPALGVSDARFKAGEYMAIAQTGIAPMVHEKKKTRERRQDQKRTFAYVVDLFDERYLAQNSSSTHRRETNRIFRVYVLPEWAELPISEITRSDVIELLDRVEDNHGIYMANRTLAAVRKLFNWAADERGLIEAVPVGRKMTRGKEKKRARILSDGELRTLWQTCDALEHKYPWGVYCKMLILTGQRREEVAGIRWDRISEAPSDKTKTIWRLEPEETKNQRQHVVPLSDFAMEVLSTAPRVHDTLVFTTTGRTPVSGFSRAKKTLDENSGVIEWRFHDLRRTLATNLRALGFSRDVVGSVLNHKPMGVTAEHYDLYDMLPEKTRALQAWGNKLHNILSDTKADNVVGIHE
jgi:integrase